MNKIYYLFHRNQIVTCSSSKRPLPLSHEKLASISPKLTDIILPDVAVIDRHFSAELVEGAPLPAEYHLTSLRSLVGQVDDETFSLWGRASQLLHWYKSNKYCGFCGKETVPHPQDLARHCPACKKNHYPVISPCIIVLVHRAGEILLARSPRFPEKMYSTLAGFIEPGESAEQTLHREVFEEVGIQVHNINYFASQSWPFPGQLMLGFFAEYLSGKLTIDNDEICDAAWYQHHLLPEIPGPSTIAGQLIRFHLGNSKKVP